MATLSRLAFAFGAPAIIMASVLGVAWLSTTRLDTVIGPGRSVLFTPPSDLPSVRGSDIVEMPRPPANADEAVPAWQAQARNALIPFSRAPLLGAAKFYAASDKETPVQALQCLSSAVYYEATGEPDAGKRAVAQVVVNRWANRLFPKTICGVVDQGAPAPGCQFSFMCDGALGRRPSAKAWADAEMIARGALNGYVETSVGAATHYHADYVVPVWAPTMLKLVKLGRHIFYRWPGAAAYMGEPPADAAMSPPPAASDASAALAAPIVESPPPTSLPPTSQASTNPAPGDAPRRDPVIAKALAVSPPPPAPPAAGPDPLSSPAPKPTPAPDPARRPVPAPSLRVGPL